MWKLYDLVRSAKENLVFTNGVWVPARPINWKYRSISERLREAWAVFTGKAEAFTWPENQ